MDSGGGCTIMWIYLMPLNTPKHIKTVNFMLWIYSKILKIHIHHGLCVYIYMKVDRTKNVFLSQSTATSFI